MKTKTLCLIISLITLITFASCTANKPMTQSDSDVPDEFVSSCNKNSGGYINFLKGKYYYRNTADKGSLYVSDADGKNAACIDSCTDETILHIRVDETAVYYLKRTLLDTPLDIAGHLIPFDAELRRFCDGKVTVLSEENVFSYAMSKDYVFYSTTDLKVYRMKHNGTEKTAILDLHIPMTLTVSGDRLYAYTEESIISMDFDGKNLFNNRLYIYTVAFDKSSLYYINLNSCNLFKSELSETDTHAAIDNIQSITSEEIISFTVYNGRLVYERMFTGEIVIADMDGNNPQVVCKGACPIVLNGHLFYLDNGVIKVADV